MLGKFIRNLDHRLAIAGIIIILAGTVVAWRFGGLRFAGIVAFLLFVFLGGLECLWAVLTHAEAEKEHDRMDARDQERFDDKSGDNPTIR